MPFLTEASLVNDCQWKSCDLNSSRFTVYFSKDLRDRDFALKLKISWYREVNCSKNSRSNDFQTEPIHLQTDFHQKSAPPPSYANISKQVFWRVFSCGFATVCLPAFQVNLWCLSIGPIQFCNLSSSFEIDTFFTIDHLEYFHAWLAIYIRISRPFSLLIAAYKRFDLCLSCQSRIRMDLVTKWESCAKGSHLLAASSKGGHDTN